MDKTDADRKKTTLGNPELNRYSKIKQNDRVDPRQEPLGQFYIHQSLLDITRLVRYQSNPINRGTLNTNETKEVQKKEPQNWIYHERNRETRTNK